MAGWAWVAASVGCSYAGTIEGELELTLSETIPTVVSAAWESAGGADSAHVLVGSSGLPASRVVPTSETADGYSTVVLGLQPSTEYTFWAVESHADRPLLGSPQVLRTGPTPTGMPHLTTEAKPPGPTGGYVVTSLVSFPSMAIIVDSMGQYVWWHQLSPPEGEEWETFYIPRVALSRDGRSVLYEAATGVASSSRERIIVRVSMDGSTVESLPATDAHHDFLELPDGTLALLKEDNRPVEDTMIEGDQIVELGTDGAEKVAWSIWDHAEFDPSQPYDPEIGWSHANALQYDSDEDAYYVSLRNFDAIYKIDRASGSVLWIAGGEAGSFELPDGDTLLFERQHHFEVLPDGLLVFDNRVPEENSRAVEYALDHDLGVATHTWEYMSDPPVFTMGFGDVQRLQNGNTIVDWSAQGRIDEVTPGGDLVWSLSAEIGAGFGYFDWFESFD